MSIKVTGDNPTALGKSYEQGIHDVFGSQSFSDVLVKGVGRVDDVVNKEELAFEAKYTDNFALALQS